MRYIGLMKTRSLIIALSFIAISITGFAQEISNKQIAFANKFVTAVADHSEKKTMKYLDKTYRKAQLAFLEGNKDQLVNELFGGQDLSDKDKYLNFKISEITQIEIIEVISLKGTSDCTYIFKLKRGDQEILASLLLKVNGKKFGFEGAMG
ncbi:MAG: hypothetical protein ACJA1C_001277 [Crocinitomicaceae bacterium]|jgi:hypothetical protein